MLADNESISLLLWVTLDLKSEKTINKKKQKKKTFSMK